jgi:hypothetical protein
MATSCQSSSGDVPRKFGHPGSESRDQVGASPSTEAHGGTIFWKFGADYLTHTHAKEYL